MMELKIIRNQPHIAFKDGKREVVKTAAEAIEHARKRITDSQSMLQSLANTRAEQQDRLENALLGGGNTAGARRELTTISELIDDQNNEIADALNDISQIEKLIDAHRADEIFDTQAKAIQALTQPFDDFLKGIL